jgi:hypothetical protein
MREYFNNKRIGILLSITNASMWSYHASVRSVPTGSPLISGIRNVVYGTNVRFLCTETSAKGPRAIVT